MVCRPEVIQYAAPMFTLCMLSAWVVKAWGNDSTGFGVFLLLFFIFFVWLGGALVGFFWSWEV